MNRIADILSASVRSTLKHVLAKGCSRFALRRTRCPRSDRYVNFVIFSLPSNTVARAATVLLASIFSWCIVSVKYQRNNYGD
jgi:hypothetical protein